MDFVAHAAASKENVHWCQQLYNIIIYYVDTYKRACVYIHIHRYILLLLHDYEGIPGNFGSSFQIIKNSTYTIY